jgi:hypothetical protein
MAYSKEEEEEKDKSFNPLGEMTHIIYMVVSLYAMYLSFKINKGLSWSIIPAFLFSPIYLVYVFAVHGSKPFKTSFK